MKYFLLKGLNGQKDEQASIPYVYCDDKGNVVAQYNKESRKQNKWVKYDAPNRYNIFENISTEAEECSWVECDIKDLDVLPFVVSSKEKEEKPIAATSLKQILKEEVATRIKELSLEDLIRLIDKLE